MVISKECFTVDMKNLSRTLLIPCIAVKSNTPSPPNPMYPS